MKSLHIRRSLIALALLVIAAVVLPGRSAEARRQEKPKFVPWVALAADLPSTPGKLDHSTFLDNLLKAVNRESGKNMPSSAANGEKGKVTVRFKVMKDGNILGGSVKVEKSSGKRDMDEAAVRAVQDAAPFKDFPKSLEGEGLEIRLTLGYNSTDVPANMLS
jgi:TonB family protein